MHRSFTAAAVLAALGLAAAATAPFAQGQSAVAERQEIMKTVGKSAKSIGEMLKGATEFDAATANAALVAMQAAVAEYGTRFPEGSEATAANKSAAAPTIWSDRAGFEAVLAEFKGDIDAAVTASPQEKETLAAAFGAVGENCGTCHKTYRLKLD